MNQSTNLADNSGTSRLGKSSQSSAKLEKRTTDSTENEVEKYHNGLSNFYRVINSYLILQRFLNHQNCNRHLF